MRKIIYRGKTTKKPLGGEFNNIWVEGDLIQSKDKMYIHPKANSFEVDGELSKLVVMHEVVPETVGQFTSLTDKNGKKIFEGDILRGEIYPYRYNGEYNYFAEVCWWDNSPAFGIYTFKNPLSSVCGISTGNTESMGDWEFDKWEVIGNIHDNPELLK